MGTGNFERDEDDTHVESSLNPETGESVPKVVRLADAPRLRLAELFIGDEVDINGCDCSLRGASSSSAAAPGVGANIAEVSGASCYGGSSFEGSGGGVAFERTLDVM